MKKLKIIQIGITHEHAPGKFTSLKALGDVFEIAGFVDERSFAKTPFYKEPKLALYEEFPSLSLEEALNSDADAVTVEVPNNDLVLVAMLCMKHKKAMHMDKPAGMDLELYGKLLAGCKKNNVPFQMGYMFRSNPAFKFALEAAGKGWFGEIFEVEADMNHDYGDDAYDAYLGKFKGGIVYNLGCHFFDFFAALLGRPEKITTTLRSTPGVPENFHNSGMTLLEYPHATALFKASARVPSGIPRRRLRISGTKGGMELSPLELFNAPWRMELFFKEGNDSFTAGRHTVELPPVADRYEGQLRELAAMIKGEVESPWSFEHDFMVHEISLRASGVIPSEKEAAAAKLIDFL